MKHILSFLFILFFSASFAQDRTRIIDSLKLCLQTAKDDSTRASILRETGLLYVDMGNYPKAIEFFLKAKDLFESIKNNYGVFRCENILGVTYSYMGDQKTALIYLLNAKKGINDGILYDNLGLIYYNSNYQTNSLIYWKMALDFYKQKHDTILIARLLNDIGSLYELQGKSDTAIIYYNECLKTSNDKMNLSGAYASLGDIYFKQGKYSIALQYENKSLKLAKEIGNLISVRETHKMLSDIYLKIGDCQASLVHYKNYVSIKDTLVNEDNIKQIVRVEENSKFEKEKEIAKVEQVKKDAVTEQEKQKQIIIIYSVGIVLILVLIFSIFSFRAFKINKKAKDIIAKQNISLEHQKKEVIDSINYAQRIQQALLPSQEYLQIHFPTASIIYKPKDIVSGDFYWAYSDGDNKYFAVADCTGHGVPGAMMSMIGISLLNEIVIERKITQPDLVLNALREEIVKSLNKQGASEERKDGMDISFCKISTQQGYIGHNLQCASANNSIYVVRGTEIMEIKPDKFPVGKFITDNLFTLNTHTLMPDDMLYAVSDGFCDQFGGDKGKKLMSKRFKEWITSFNHSYIDIKQGLETRFDQWKGKEEQVDDVTIVAIKI